MKKRLELMLILLLTSAFMSCPALVNRAFAGGEKSSDPASPRKIGRVFLQIAGKDEALPDFEITYPTSIQDVIDFVANSDVAKKVQEVHDSRVDVRAKRVEKIKDLFGGGTPASGN